MKDSERDIQHKTVRMLRNFIHASNMSLAQKDMFDLLVCAYFPGCKTRHGDNAVLEFLKDATQRGYVDTEEFKKFNPYADLA